MNKFLADIRSLVESEITILSTELLSYGRHIDHYQRLNSQYEGKCLYFVAWDGERPIGHVIIHWDSDMPGEPKLVRNLHIPRVEDLWVMPYRRGEGTASQLMEHVEALVKAHGFYKVGLDVSLHNELARTIYEKRGYQNTGIPSYELRGVSVVNGQEFPWQEPDCIFLTKKL